MISIWLTGVNWLPVLARHPRRGRSYTNQSSYQQPISVVFVTISTNQSPCLLELSPPRAAVHGPRTVTDHNTNIKTLAFFTVSKFLHHTRLGKTPTNFMTLHFTSKYTKKGPVPCNIFQIPVKFCDQVSSSPPQLQCFGPCRAIFGPVAVFWSESGQIYVTYQRHRTVLLQPGHWSKRLCYTWLMESSWCDTSGIYW